MHNLLKTYSRSSKILENGRLPIPNGVRCRGPRDLKRIVDHFHSESHKAAADLDLMQVSWMMHLDNYPWIKTLKSHNAETVKLLIELRVDVFNYSRQLTLSVIPWPSRFLAKMHAELQVASYKDDGLSSQISEFKPSSSSLHYRNPTIYREMLDIVGGLVMEKAVGELNEAGCFSLQVFGGSKADTQGAEELMDVVKIVLRDLKIDDLAKKSNSFDY